MPAPEFMRLALQNAREGLASGQTPFGACIVRRWRAALVPAPRAPRPARTPEVAFVARSLGAT